MTELLGLQTINVFHPNEYGVNDDGDDYDTGRVATPMRLVIDPMTQGQFSRYMGQEGVWTGGAIMITAETDVLSTVDSVTRRPADHVEYRSRRYQVIRQQPWDDPDFPELACVTYVASLLNTQPTP